MFIIYLIDIALKFNNCMFILLHLYRYFYFQSVDIAILIKYCKFMQFYQMCLLFRQRKFKILNILFSKNRIIIHVIEKIDDFNFYETENLLYI